MKTLGVRAPFDATHLQIAWERFRKSVLARAEALKFQHGGHEETLERIAEGLRFSLTEQVPTAWVEEARDFLPICTVDGLDAVRRAMEQGERATEPLTVLLTAARMGDACPFCGEWMAYAFDGQTFTATPCPIRDEPFVLTFKTGGYLVIQDDLRDQALAEAVTKERAARGIANDGNLDFSLRADRNVARLYEGAGLIAFRVGNTCPNVYRLPPTEERSRFQIGTDGYNRDDMGLRTGDPFPPDGEFLFSVTTNAPLACWMDLAAYRSRGGVVDSTMQILEVPEGSYEARIHAYERPFVRDTAGRPTIFATVRQTA